MLIKLKKNGECGNRTASTWPTTNDIVQVRCLVFDNNGLKRTDHSVIIVFSI